MPTAPLAALLFVHIAICLALFALASRGVLKARPSCVALPLFVPVFGLVGFALLEARLRDDGARCEEFDIEELRVNDAVHRSIVMEQSTVGDAVVPLREALLLNDPTARRELIMDVLYEGAQSQPHALRAARSNDDAEVVHYATTALVELQKSYDEGIAQARAACDENPRDVDAAARLADVLCDYIESGLLEGSMLVSVRADYARALEGLMALLPHDDSRGPEVCLRAFDNARARGDADGMAALARRACSAWPRREEGHLMALRCAVAARDRAGVDEALAALTGGEVRLSAQGRREVAYWKEAGDAGVR